jgi:probable rRNA maturation factor
MGAMSIEIANESGIDVDDAALIGLARHVLDAMKIHPQADLSILLVARPDRCAVLPYGRAAPATR